MKFVWKEEKGSCKNNSFEQDAARSVQKGCFSLQFITVVSEIVAVTTVEFKERIYMNKYWWKKKSKDGRQGFFYVKKLFYWVF